MATEYYIQNIENNEWGPNIGVYLDELGLYPLDNKLQDNIRNFDDVDKLSEFKVLLSSVSKEQLTQLYQDAVDMNNYLAAEVIKSLL